jgi:dienelactone hydrolase
MIDRRTRQRRIAGAARGIGAAVLLWALAGCGGGGGSGPTPTGKLTITSCTLPEGAASCDGTIGWSTANAASPRLTLDGVVLSEQPSGTVTVALPGDFVDAVLSDGTRTLDSVTFRGRCETASAWDGSQCTAYGVRLDERAPTPFFEDGQPVELEVVIFRPFGSGPFPTVMFNHGSTGDGSDPSLFALTTVSETVARFFVDRGWMVAFPQRRGRGQSDGLYDEGFNATRTFYSCQREVTLAGAQRAIDDLDAAVDWLRLRADVDTNRMLVSGASRGGVLAIAHVARRPDVYLGAVNFVGGWLGEGCGDYLEVNRTLFVEGAGFPDDTIWLYANNDSFYSIAHSRSNFDAYTAAGGLGTWHVYTRAPGLNGHFLTNDPERWGPDVEAYLAQLP